MLLCNLAISDLGVGLAVQPLYVAVYIAELNKEADLSCKLGATCQFIAICLGALSLFGVTAISVDRFLAVYLVNKYRGTVTMKKAKLVVVSLWLVAITYMIIHLLNRTVYYIFAIIAMIFCLLFTSCNYIAIGRMLQRSHVRTQAYYHIHTGQQNRNIFSIRRYKKTMTTMLYVYGVFLLCYLPYLRFTLTRIRFEHSSTIQGVNLITLTPCIITLTPCIITLTPCIITSFLVLFNSTLNPFLYYWRIPEMRLRIKQLFGRATAGNRSTRVIELNWV